MAARPCSGEVKELQLKPKGVVNHLGCWERQTFGHVRRELQSLKKDLEKMQADPSRLGPSQAELKIIERINELHHRKENYVASAFENSMAGGRGSEYKVFSISERAKGGRI
jgi:hypothetical protein